jgi:uncharacterized protein
VKPPRFSIERRAPATQWLALLLMSLLFAALLESLRLPAALLLGPMIAALLLAMHGAGIRVPGAGLFACQAIIGCMIARALTGSIVGSFLTRWPLFLAIVLAIVAACSLLGWALSRWRILPGSTAVWGLSPGAASAMVLMAGAFGADVQLVAFMQYLRVVMVATLATIIARWVVGVHAAATSVAWFPPVHALAFAETLALALLAGLLGRVARIPAGVLLVPMAAGAILNARGLVTIELPPWLLAASYALLGWSIGLGFTRPILAAALRALPQIFGAILALLAFAGVLAWVLVKAFGVDPLTAYLATSPGGADSVAIIAASSRVDLSFVMALQTIRFMFVLLAGPATARFVARRVAQAGP